MPEIQESLIELIESRALKEKIKETQLTFSDMELLRIAYFYSPDFDSRIENMRAVAENASEEIKAYADQLISAQKEAFEQLKKEELGVIYELYVQDSEGNEKLNFCSSYKAALWLVVVKNRESGKSENGIKYNLVKRYISKRDENEGKNSSNIAEAVLLSEGKLCSVEIDDLPLECDGECENCGRPCLYREDILFPSFLKENDLVSYRDINGEIKYGIVVQVCEELLESCRVLSLESPAIAQRDFENGTYVTKFIAPPFIEPIEPDALSEPFDDNYEAYLQYLGEKASMPEPTAAAPTEVCSEEISEKEENNENI